MDDHESHQVGYPASLNDRLITRLSPTSLLGEQTMYRISRVGQEPVGVDTFKALMSAIGSSAPGRYRIDEISADPRPTDHAVQKWGIGIKWADGSVEIERDEWHESHLPA